MLSFCAFQWKFVLKMIWEDAKNISEDRYMEVRYKNLVEKPEESFSKILDFYGLEYNERIQRYLEQKELENMN
ncbi:MAG: sulfotransferase [Candidatus Thermoplasmatota archaeon]